MGQFVFTVGCPGAGKSAYAQLRTYHGWHKLCLDDFRVAIWGSKQNYWKIVNATGHEAQDAKATLSAIYGAAFDRLSAVDANVVLPNCHLTFGERDFLKARERRHCARIVVFTTPIEELLKRNAARDEDDRVTEEFLLAQHDIFTSKPGWWMNYADAIERRA